MMYATREEAHASYRQVLTAAKAVGDSAVKEVSRRLCQTDLFYLLYYGLHREDIDHDWLYDRCKEVQDDPYGYLDVWAREHYKSTIITFAFSIQSILNDPEITICIFSFVNPIAKAFLGQIKFELETNTFLKTLFDDILWEDPRVDAVKAGVAWGLDKGITVKRKGNMKEATIETSGLSEGQKTGPHYKVRLYDDVITKEQVTNPEMIEKVTTAWEFSINLGMEGGVFQVVGTFYHLADTYKVMMDRGAVKPRIHPGTDDGKATGNPVLKSRKWMHERQISMGSYVFSSQILCNPKAEGSIGFKTEWVKYWNRLNWHNMNVIVICDPAGEKKKGSDWTAIWVIGLGSDRNIYVLDMVRDRLSLTQRANVLFVFHRDYRPTSVYYEKIGLQSDIEHFEDRMDRENYRFHITPVGGTAPKNDRIRGLIPWFENSRIFMPEKLIRLDYQDKAQDLVQHFLIHEMDPFPFGGHDDMIDSLARLTDEKVSLDWPEPEFEGDHLFNIVPHSEEYDPFADA